MTMDGADNDPAGARPCARSSEEGQRFGKVSLEGFRESAYLVTACSYPCCAWRGMEGKNNKMGEAGREADGTGCCERVLASQRYP